MSKVLVFVDHVDGDIKRSSLELLTATQASGLETKAVVVGAGAASAAAKVGTWGVAEVLVCDDARLKDYNPELYGSLFSDIIKSESPAVLLASSTTLARDLFPRLAGRFDAGIASDCVALQLNSAGVSATKPLYSGKCTATVEFQNCALKIVLMRANQMPVGAAKGGAAPVRALSLSPVDLKTVLKEVVRGVSGKLDLTEANVVVAGGRGMKGPEHFKLLEDLAATLNATVGASRAVVDAGWVSHSMQVGQTGKTVAPSLYIACGISGAIQHLAGMSGSKVIVAINKDPDAPIFQKATYGIVGDVFEVVPALTEELKKLRQ